jgi:hypothetical protein
MTIQCPGCDYLYDDEPTPKEVIDPEELGMARNPYGKFYEIRPQLGATGTMNIGLRRHNGIFQQAYLWGCPKCKMVFVNS